MTPLFHSIRLFLICDGVESYKILLKANVAKEYETVASEADRYRIRWMIAALTDEPRRAEASVLGERKHQRRICLKRHRVIFEVDDCKRQVTVFRIVHRRRQDSAW